MHIKKLASIQAPILLLGETGCGKSYTALKIHEESYRKEHPFLTAHLGAMSETLFESELFGHAKGSFTGAHAERKGFCEAVGEGTLFLDEIGELSLAQQKKLLFFLEERKFHMVGSCQVKSFKGQIIAATHKDLLAFTREGKFREDLYYRLSIFVHKILPLRKRRDLILSLASGYLKLFSKRANKLGLNFSEDLSHFFKTYSWPGNIRELKNTIEFLVYSSEGLSLEYSDLPYWIKEGPNLTKMEQIKSFLNYHDALESFEREYLNQALRLNGGGINLTSRKVNLSKSTLLAKIRKYGIDVKKLKSEFQESRGH